MQGSPARAHVLSWYQQLISQVSAKSARRASPNLADIDPAQNAIYLTVGNANSADEGTYYCAMCFSGQFIFGEGTHLLYQGESEGVGQQWSRWQWA